jgi:phosphoinositide-3-kinase, regulatory subunit 4
MRTMKVCCRLGSARFLKTVRCTHSAEGEVVLKVFAKHDPQIKLTQYFQALSALKKQLVDVPNVLPFAQAMETDRAGYLLRQYVYSSLYDRIRFVFIL